MRHLFHILDIFRAPFLLRINGKEKTSTFWGLMFSFGILIFLAVFFINSDVLYHRRPTIVDQELFLRNKLKIDFDGDTFGLVVALVDDPGNVYSDGTIFSIKMTQYVLNVSTHGILSQDEKKLHFCDQKDYPNEPSTVDVYGLRNYLCPSNKSFTVYGGWDEPMINHIYVTISLCDNKTMNNTCKSSEEIKTFLSDKYASISFKDSSFDLNNYENPVQNSYKNLWWTLSAEVRKTAILYWKKVDIVTDDGFVFQQSTRAETFQKDEQTIDIDLNYKEYIFQAEFYSSPKMEAATRTYQKIQEVVASIGGLLSLFVSLGFILTGPQTRLNVIKNMMNNLYVFHKKGVAFKEVALGESEARSLFIGEMKEKIEKKPNIQKLANYLTTNMTETKLPLFDKAEGNLFRNESKNEVEITFFSKEEIKGLENTNRCQQIKKNPEISTRFRSHSQESKKGEFFHLGDFSSKRHSSHLKKFESEKKIINRNSTNEELGLFTYKEVPTKDSKEGTKKGSPNSRIEEIPNPQINFVNEKRQKLNKTQTSTSNLASFFSKFKRKSSLFHTQPSEVEKIKALEETIEHHKNEFAFSLYEYFKYNMKRMFGFELNFKEKLFKKTEKAFKKEVDLISILNKIHEINKMKLLFLNQRQLTLFDLLSKPMIFVDERKWMNRKKTNNDILNTSFENNPAFKLTNFIRQGRKAQKRKETIVQCYEETLKYKSSNSIDERLLFFMEQKVEGKKE